MNTCGCVLRVMLAIGAGVAGGWIAVHFPNPLQRTLVASHPASPSRRPSKTTVPNPQNRSYTFFSVAGFLHPSNWLNTASRIPGRQFEILPKVMRCPKVYIYTPPVGLKLQPLTFYSMEQAFGIPQPSSVPGLRRTNQYSLAAIFTSRLRRSGCHTHRPQEANLFMFPFGVKDDKVRDYDHCRVRKELPAFSKALRWLSPTTLSKHFIVNGFQWPFVRWNCFFNNDDLISAREKKIRTLLLQVPWVNIEVRFELWQGQLFPLLAKQPLYQKFLCGGNHTEPHHGLLEQCHDLIINMPRPASLHWNRALVTAGVARPWEQQQQQGAAGGVRRDILVSYIGRGAAPDSSRWAVQDMCNRYNESSNVVCRGYSNCSQAYEIKARSVFCLDPAGDSPGRRSTIDSYAVGCIPVFLGIVQAFLYPELWTGWHDSAFLVLDEVRVREGKDDIVKLLEAVPKSAVEHMQAQIAKYAPRFLYNEEDIPEIEDGLTFLLRGLHARSLFKT